MTEPIEEIQDEPDRFRYWAEWRMLPDRGGQVGVSYRIAGEGSGWYLRPGGPPILLFRWDGERLAGSSLGPGGLWHENEGPARNVYLGSDYGSPVTARTARAIASAMGAPGAVDDHEVQPRT